mmetsp:Transcript_11278/g.15166  ORF Transcript_11278/g.15166 Transcript_11278/m.15166 type:complete len:276 (-) Transcript_11278:261-1088(-)
MAIEGKKSNLEGNEEGDVASRMERKMDELFARQRKDMAKQLAELMAPINQAATEALKKAVEATERVAKLEEQFKNFGQELAEIRASIGAEVRKEMQAQLGGLTTGSSGFGGRAASSVSGGPRPQALASDTVAAIGGWAELTDAAIVREAIELRLAQWEFDFGKIVTTAGRTSYALIHCKSRGDMWSLLYKVKKCVDWHTNAKNRQGTGPRAAWCAPSQPTRRGSGRRPLASPSRSSGSASRKSTSPMRSPSQPTTTEARSMLPARPCTPRVGPSP